MSQTKKRASGGKAADAGPAPLRLEGELSIYRALEIREILLAALEGNQELAIDLSGVSEIDTAGVQLLLAAKRSALVSGRALRLAATNPAVQDVLDLFDVKSLFESTPA